MELNQLNAILESAKQAAILAHDEYANTHLGGKDTGTCGFAWVDILEFENKKLDGRSKIAKILRDAGLEHCQFNRRFSVWNPSKSSYQNIDVKEAAATAYAKELNKHGFKAVAYSQVD